MWIWMGMSAKIKKITENLHGMETRTTARPNWTMPECEQHRCQIHLRTYPQTSFVESYSSHPKKSWINISS